MKNREHALVNQVKTSHKIINRLMKIVQGIEQKEKTFSEDRHWLDAVATLDCSSFTYEGITKEFFSEPKVFQLG